MKKIFNIIILFIFLQSLLLFSCKENTTKAIDNGKDSTLTQNFNIFYPMSQSQGWRPEHSGLFKFVFPEDKTPDRIQAESIVHTSNVGESGILTLEYEYATPKFWGLCTDGNFSPVPFPVSDDENNWLYKHVIPPHIDLSLSGHQAVYFVSLNSTTNQDPYENKLTMIIFDCNKWHLNKYEIRAFYLNQFADDSVNFAKTFDDYCLINDDATKVWFVLQLINYENSNYNTVGYSICEFNNGVFSAISEISKDEITFAGMDLKSEKIFAYVGSELKVLSDKKFVNTMLTKDNMSNPRQFARENDEMVVWTENGISLFNPNTEAIISEVISWDDIEAKYPCINKQSTKFLSISNDGGLIAFGIDKKSDPPSYDLFAVRRNGKDLIKIVSDSPIGIPVISNGYNK